MREKDIWERIKFRYYETDNIGHIKRMKYAEPSIANMEMFFGDADRNNNIMQYTGLKDKNNKEIYEGDIFHLGDKNIRYIVVWNDTGFMGKQIKANSYVGLKYWQDRIEIIGNKYENSNLLN